MYNILDVVPKDAASCFNCWLRLVTRPSQHVCQL